MILEIEFKKKGDKEMAGKPQGEKKVHDEYKKEQIISEVREAVKRFIDDLERIEKIFREQI